MKSMVLHWTFPNFERCNPPINYFAERRKALGSLNPQKKNCSNCFKKANKHFDSHSRLHLPKQKQRNANKDL